MKKNWKVLLLILLFLIPLLLTACNIVGNFGDAIKDSLEGIMKNFKTQSEEKPGYATSWLLFKQIQYSGSM